MDTKEPRHHIIFTQKTLELAEEGLSRQSTATLPERLAHYGAVVDNAHDLLLSLTPDGAFIFANRAWHETLGYSQEDLAKLSFLNIVDASCRDRCRDNFSSLMRGERVDRIETIFVAREGREIPVEGRCTALSHDGQAVAMTGIFRDISQQKKTEEALRHAHDALEHQVTLRTQDLSEANGALDILLKRYEQYRNQLEQQIIGSLTEKVSPIIERLKKSGLRDSQKNYIELIEAGIREILSPSPVGQGIPLTKLTSTEKTVANLIASGQTTKKIAMLLGISPATVSKHRENIRKKMGITNKKKSLVKSIAKTP